ncbi:hypothetical protein MLD38_024262 [Melastoma candidum]|uniref:Uncharacterized protein n=1 Tax=Melastoma candidum TaxID=119954 RepID=A0ACB9NUF5_9MYRT|nr:hypothetical protein MLD38_024262 [Melastoma candidum]
METLSSLAYPPPPPTFLNAFTVLCMVTMPFTGFSEVNGVHLQYSKFWNVGPRKKFVGTVSGRTGMAIIYLPALLASISSLTLFGRDEGLRFLLLRLSLTVHFLKRVLEVLFVHKFSAQVAVDAMIVISFSYLMMSACTIYSLLLCQSRFREPAINLTYPGLVLFLIGIGGNFYHHLLLSRLRGKYEKEYKIPKGGLFDWVICPHYLFEIIDFIGIAFLCQTTYSFVVAMNTIFYLAGRSHATRKWYRSKFEDFPEGVKALVPYVF